MAGGNVPLRVMVPEYAWRPLQARAHAEGFTSATAFVEARIIDFTLGGQQNEKILELHAIGATNKEIADATGLTVGSIRYTLHKNHLTSHRKKPL